jgi:hypothetical protein
MIVSENGQIRISGLRAGDIFAFPAGFLPPGAAHILLGNLRRISVQSSSPLSCPDIPVFGGREAGGKNPVPGPRALQLSGSCAIVQETDW